MMLRLFYFFIVTFSCTTAKIEFIQSPRGSIVTLGQSSLTLDCVARSKPESKLQYMWSFNGTSVDKKADILSSHSLYIPNIQISDIGWYQCSVMNEEIPQEKAVSPKAYVIRPFLEKFQVHPESTIVRIGETVILTCLTGRGAPPPKVHWEKDGTIFKGGVQNVKVIPIKDQPMVTQTKMTLELTANDVVSGEFVCSAENNLTKVSYRSEAGVVQSAVLFREFNEEPEDMTVKLGDSAVLACDPPHSVPPAIAIWYKNNERLQIDTQDFTERFGHWDLRFDKIRYEDSGEYFCVAFNNYTLPQTRTSQTAVLSVIGPPQIIEPPSSQNIIQKMTLKLVCQVEGQPIPVVSWYHNKNIVTPTSRTFLRNSNQELWVTNVNKGDDGSYSCHVKNKYGNRTAVALISVAVPPTILLPIGKVVAEENSTKILNCQVYGDPHPLVFWAKDGLPLLTINSRFKVLDTGLKIINISHGDEGNYTCTAVNDAGNQSVSGVLTVESGPHFVSFPQNTVTQMGHSVLFVCDAVGDPKPRITWTFNDSFSLPLSVNKSRDGHRLYIDSMSWKEVGKYTCFAENLRSIKNKTAYLFLQVPSKILSVVGNTILAVEDRLELTCKTTGLPPPHIYWLHNGRRIWPTRDGRIFFPSPEKFVANFITRHDTGNYTCFAFNSAYNVSQTVRVHIVGQPKAPRLKSLYAVSSSSVILEWEPTQQEPFTNVTGYIVRYKRESEYKPHFTLYMDNITSSTTHLQVNGLNPAQTYVFTVTAKNRVGEGSPSEMQSVTTWQAAPSEPVRLQVVKTSPVSICLSWWRPRELHGTIKKYQLVRNALNWTKDQIVEELVNIDSPFVSHTVRGLHPFTAYIFKVRAANMQNGTELWGNFSSALTVSTEMRAPSSSPQNLTVQPLKGRIVYLTWQPPSKFYQNGPLKQYVVRYQSVSPIEGCEDKDVHYYASEGHSANISGLLPGTEYIFQISLENEAGRGPPSDIVRVSTLPEAPTGSPQNIIAKSPSPKRIEVFWNPPIPDQQNSKITSYLLEIYKPNGEKINYIIYDDKGLSKHPKSVFHKEITGLKPWTTYKVRVAAVTNQVERGQGPFSNMKVIRTLETAPGPVFNLSYEVIGSVIQLFWQPPLQPNGNIRWYHISFTMIGPANSTDSMDNSTTINSSTGDLLQDKAKHNSATASSSEALQSSGSLVTSNLSTVLTNLLPHSRYNVSISASTSTGGLGNPTMVTFTTGAPLQNSSLYKSTVHNNSWNVPTTSATTTPKILSTSSYISYTSMKSGSGSLMPRASADSSLQDLPVIVAGSLTAGLVFIFLLGVLIYHCVKNKKKRQKEQNYMMFYAYEDIGGLHPDDPVRHNRLQQTQLTSPEVRKATSYGCKEDVPIIKTQDNNSDGPSTDRDLHKIEPNQDKVVSPFKLDPFLVAFFHHLVPYALINSPNAGTSGSSEDDVNISFSQYKKVLHDMLLYIPMETSTSFNVALRVLRAYIEQCSKKRPAVNSFQHICDIMRLLESKHALALDESVQMCLKNESCPKVKEAVFSLLNSSLESARFKMLPDLGVSLTFGLHHPEAEVRIQAINFLIKQKFNVAEDSTFYEETLLMRLKDDSPDVVLTVLKAGEVLWILMDHQKLFSTLMEILIASDTKENWQTLDLSVVKVLITCPDQKMYLEILVSLFPFLIIMSTSDVPLLDSVLKSKLATVNSLPSDPLDSESAKDVIAQVIIKKVNESPPNERLSLMTSIFNSLANHSCRKPIYVCFLLNVFFKIYGQQNKLSKLSYELCLLVLNNLKKILHNKSNIKKDMKKKLMPWAKHFSVDQFRKQHCAKFLGEWISSLEIIDSLKVGGTFWEYRNDGSTEDVCIQLIIHLFGLLVKISSKYEEFQTSEQKLVNIFLGEMVHQDVFDKFLCFLWTSDTQDHTVAIINQLQLSALKTGYIWIKSVAPNYVRKWMLSPVPVMVSMIVALGSKMDMVRHAAASCLPVVYPRGHRKELPYHFFLKKLIANLNRIESNSDLSKVISEILLNEESDDSDTEKSKDISSRKRAIKDIFDVIILESTPSYIVNSILNAFREFNSIELVKQLTPLLSRLLNLAKKNALTKSQLQSLQCLLERFDKDIACHLTVSTCTLQLFCNAMSINKSGTAEPQETQIQELAIKQVDKEFYMNLPNDASQQKVIYCLFNAWVGATTMSTPELIRKSLKHFPMKSSYLEAELNIFEKTPIYSTVRENKRIQKLTNLKEGNELDSLEWQRVTIVLETLQNKKKLSKPGILLPICFKLLSRVMELEENNSAEYLKQLLLSCICNISGRMIGDPSQLAELQSSKFNMELIVKCIRSSSSPQTHHHALLLLTVAAKINPELLLHNVMAVFTFVGGTMVRQDDTYSFNMIYRTLETVIPPLLAACEERAKTSQQEIGTADDVVVMVLKVFVDAFPHIPSHRRVMLFPELTRIIGQGKHLWCLLLLLIEHFVVHGSTKSHTENPETNDALPLELEFCLSLSVQFSPEQQLDAIYNSILYLSKLPPTIKQGTVTAKPPLPEKLTQWQSADVEIFNINYHTNKRLWHFKYATINFFVSLLSSTDFISQISTTSETVLQDNYQKLLETILHYLSYVSKMTKMQQDPEPARFWKMLLNQVSNLLDKVCSLLPDNVFIEVVSTLVNHKLTTVQRKSMELLNSKLQQFTDDLHEDTLQLLLPLVKKLTDIVETKLLIQHSVDETNIVIGQTALFSLKLLCRRLAGRGVKEFSQTLRVSTEVLKQRQDSVQLLACAVLCIGEVCSAPINDVLLLKQISLTMPSVINLFKNTDFLLGNSLLLLSTVTMVHRIVEHKSAFISPYLSDILQYICFLSSLESLDIQNLVQRLKAVRSIVAMSIPSRVLIPTVAQNYSIFLAEKTNCLPCLMTILSEHIANKMTKDDVVIFLEKLQQFFLICLDFRLDSNEVDKEVLELIESEVMTAIINTVMKLSEAKFKPVFLKFYAWATTDESKPLRVLVFYRLADSLAGSLRSLFPMFAGHIVKHMAHVLDYNHKEKNPSLKWKKHTSTLLTSIFDCAHKCFLYDTDGFVNKERFEVLMQPLVDQFENIHGRKYTERVINHLVPCLGQLAVATHDDILWKSLNYQVLLKTKHTEKEVRLASLAMLNELQQKLGEAYTTLLPETVPFLAELMEDEEEVEKRCQLLISEMEKTLGESLQKYF